MWLEVTTLLIPGRNDSPDEIDRLSEWFVRELGPDVPLHFTAFHPDFNLRDVPRTPAETCLRARQQALSHGIRYVYTGNVRDPDSQSTRCPGCHQVVIERDGYFVGRIQVARGRCTQCGTVIAGRFADGPSDRGSLPERRRIRIG